MLPSGLVFEENILNGGVFYYPLRHRTQECFKSREGALWNIGDQSLFTTLRKKNEDETIHSIGH